MSARWGSRVPLPHWCVVCLDAIVNAPGSYACPWCEPTANLKPCPASEHAYLWQPRDATLARLHGRSAA